MKIIQRAAAVLVIAVFLFNITSCVVLKTKLFPPGLLKKIEDDEDPKDSAPGQEKKDKE